MARLCIRERRLILRNIERTIVWRGAEAITAGLTKSNRLLERL